MTKVDLKLPYSALKFNTYSLSNLSSEILLCDSKGIDENQWYNQVCGCKPFS